MFYIFFQRNMDSVKVFIKTEVKDEENANAVPTFPLEETPCIEPVKSER
jgi:hypothetical protein